MFNKIFRYIKRIFTRFYKFSVKFFKYALKEIDFEDIKLFFYVVNDLIISGFSGTEKRQIAQNTLERFFNEKGKKYKGKLIGFGIEFALNYLENEDNFSWVKVLLRSDCIKEDIDVLKNTIVNYFKNQKYEKGKFLDFLYPRLKDLSKNYTEKELKYITDFLLNYYEERVLNFKS